MNKNIKKIISMVAAFAIVAAMGLGAFSFFNDYATASVESEAGTLDIALTQAIVLDDASKDGIINPGDKFDFNFNIANSGSKSVDTQTVITLVSSVEMSDAHEYRLMNGADELATGALQSDKKTIIYTLPVQVLNGSVEEETGANAIGATEVDHAYTFVFDLEAGNDFQGSTVDVKIEVFAKQHRNTESVTEWANMTKCHEFTLSGGGI